MTQLNTASDKDQQVARGETERLMKLATYAAVSLAFMLVVLKSGAWWLTGSVALLGSLVDSLLDVAASVINLLAVRHALLPRDRDHRFGHGKAEALAGLGQSIVIGLSAFYLISLSIFHLMDPQPVEHSSIGLIVTLITIVATFGLVRFQRYVVARSGSLAISADSLHYTGDLLMNLAVIASLILSGVMSWPLFDPLIGFGIALYILYSAWRIVTQSFDQLMDKEFPDDKRNRVKTVTLAHKSVLAVHDIRTRSAGSHDFIQLHIEVDASLSLVQAHQISDEVETMLMNEFPRAQILIHQDPAGLEDVMALDAH